VGAGAAGGAGAGVPAQLTSAQATGPAASAASRLRRPEPAQRATSLIDRLASRFSVTVTCTCTENNESMTLRNTASAYGSIAKLLHWTIVVLIIAQFWLGYSADDLPNGLAKLKLLATHKSIGMTVLMLAWCVSPGGSQTRCRRHPSRRRAGSNSRPHLAPVAVPAVVPAAGHRLDHVVGAQFSGLVLRLVPVAGSRQTQR
jgi:cytochrome b561